MAQTLYASFADAALAEKAAGALLDYGVQQDDISLVAHEEHGRRRQSEYDNQSSDYASTAGNSAARTGDAIGANTAGVLGATGTAAGYEAAANERSLGAAGTITSGGPSSEYGTYNNDTVAGRSDLDEMNADDDTDGSNRTDLSAKHGISTTTPGDAGSGATKGAGIGLGLGVLGAIASLMVPGFGLVLGGGALAAAVGAAAATTAAGAVAGGVTGYLKDQGVPDEAAQRYHGAVENGGALLSVNVPSGSVDGESVRQVLSKYGASDVNSY